MTQNEMITKHDFHNSNTENLLAKRRIIVLDDHADILEVIQEVLDDENYEVICVTNFQSLLNQLEHIKPDLIILDYRLPDSNGGVICEQLKSDTATSDIPLILFSAYFSKVEDLSRFACDYALTKPFDIDDLISKVKNALEESRP